MPDVARALEGLKGVRKFEVAKDRLTITVWADPELDWSAISDAIHRAGFKVTLTGR